MDDGSTDGSGEICDEYARKDERIRVIHQENRGLSCARNTGLDAITGQRVMFLDPDDAYHPNMVWILVETMDRGKKDIVLCKYSVCNTVKRLNLATKKNKTRPVALQGNYSQVQALRNMADGTINVSVWNRLYRRELWSEIRFPEGHVHEDAVTSYRIQEKANGLSILNEQLYYHRKHPGSITTTLCEKNIRDRILAFSCVELFIKKRIPAVFTDEQYHKMCSTKVLVLIHMYCMYAVKKKENEKKFEEELRYYIMEKGKEAECQICSFRIRVFYRMLCICPSVLKAVYPVYLFTVKILKTILNW